MYRRYFIVSLGAGMAGWLLRQPIVYARQASGKILELKLNWVKSTDTETTVQFTLNVARWAKRTDDDGTIRDVLSRESRRSFTRTFQESLTPAQCRTRLRAFLVQKAEEEGHEVIQ